jgi:GT2 family glycosyltransferase
MKETPLVSIITIDFNTAKDTAEFLQSCSLLTYPNIEVIVVDNCSKEAFEMPFQKENFKLLRSDTNRGFAGGNNYGLSIAKGDYIFFLNNDTLVSPDFLGPIVTFFEENPKVGIASPKVMYPDGQTIQYAGAKRINLLTGRGQRLGLFEEDHGQYDFNQPTDLGHGAALMVRRSVINKVGGMPEIYFLYYEEHDWCEQIKNNGFEMYYLGESSIIHKESVSTGNDSPLKTYYLARNRLIFMRRNCGNLQLILALLFFTFISLPKNIISLVLRGKFDLLKAYVKGVFWNIKHPKLPST